MAPEEQISEELHDTALLYKQKGHKYKDKVLLFFTRFPGDNWCCHHLDEYFTRQVILLYIIVVFLWLGVVLLES